MYVIRNTFAFMHSFRELDREKQQSLRHALFLPDQLPLVLPLLSGRISARVNGTQAYFARHLVTTLRGLLDNHGISLPSVSILKVPAGDAINLQRQALATRFPNLAKQKHQSAGSHLIDASMALATMLGQVNERFNPFHTTVSNHELENPEWLRELLPENFQIGTVDRRPIYSIRRPWTRSLFKSTIYGERFLPLWLLPDGRIAAGFDATTLN